MTRRIPHKFIDGVEHKHCCDCEEYYVLEAFTKSKGRWDALLGKCKICLQKYRESRKEKISAIGKRYRENNKEKVRAKGVRYRQNNKEKLANNWKKYYQANKEKIKLRTDNYNKGYYKKNKEKILERLKKTYHEDIEKSRSHRKKYDRRRRLNGNAKAYHKKRYHTNPNARLGHLLRGRLRIALKRQGVKKTTSTFKLTGCSLEKLKQHIEAQFYEGMSWEKRNFHIDHMQPCVLFNLEDEEEQRKCFHYTNLKPEWPSKNMSDGGRKKWNMEWNGERWIVHGRL